MSDILDMRRLAELAELLWKLQAVRLLYDHLLRQPETVNKEFWMYSVARAYCVLENRVQVVTNALQLGV
jgi:hypothetical protein